MISWRRQGKLQLFEIIKIQFIIISVLAQQRFGQLRRQHRNIKTQIINNVKHAHKTDNKKSNPRNSINPLGKKLYLSDLKTQFVQRSKHSLSRL